MARPIATVLGGTGFLGSRIVKSLARAGYQVRLAARRPDRLTPPENAEAVWADILDSESLLPVLKDAEVVINAVSLYRESKGLSFEAVHVEGAANLARCARRQGAEKFIQLSGVGVDHSSPSKYVRARARGEEKVRQEFSEAIVVRPAVLIGPGDAFVSSLAMLTKFRLVPLFGHGRALLQPVYVKDVARAIAEIALASNHSERTFELGGAEIYTYREALEVVADYYNRRLLKIPVPYACWRALTFALKFLPNPPLNYDQLVLIRQGNVVNKNLPGFAELGIEPASLESKLSDCLLRLNQ